MPFLDQYNSTGAPTRVTIQSDTPRVEPLDGPTSVPDLMERFPESVYRQDKDSHLYHFLQAVCGDAGAGLLKKQTFVERLKFEAEVLSFQDLDSLYVSHFGFARLANEVYDLDPQSQTLTRDEWNDINVKDARYRHRFVTFMQGIRFGNSPRGLSLIAQGASGIETDVFEHYKYVYDQMSDLPLGLTPKGVSTSVNELTLMPHLVDATGIVDTDASYVTSMSMKAVFTAPTYTATSRPARPNSPLAVERAYSTGTAYVLNEDIQHNVINLTDRLRPAHSIITLGSQQFRRLPIDVAAIRASSERIHLARFVSGRPEVAWPSPDSTAGYFVEGGIENEAPSTLTAQDLPAIFHTISAVHAYSEGALLDDSYDTSVFYAGSVAPFERYRSEHIGDIAGVIKDIYTTLRSTSGNDFGATKAIASHDTKLVLTGNV